MLAEADFHALADEVHDLLGSGTVHVLLGCPEQQLRHPLLEVFPSDRYHCVAGSAEMEVLLHEEQVRALCDIAIQTGQAQHSRYGKRMLAAAPLERAAGV